ncbi:pyridoxamine 5'-phosphate oxidase family protein [Nocardioides daeguensis]|uniref:Pyridoxamine 5'-phosphate oxidase family protein n=1 Tax=Nocardioides daeguensis TaxID=908359 RepID=A0ABP6UUB9_9ACTN|nr:pyridoxamine 5'-phosphate oxidase family protein [Nocardioides daeguensis]MBV6728329.1 pyridoxamine 5'-phosphate oxidase family protein [Nocardioides daeguensis]MCR1773138.1 pyridoxamine 5'-phosphate oxidase family protein [Nocardioides daeguensis]
MSTSDVRPGRLVVLSDDECWDLLRSRPVGRIAWSGDQGVSVVPVNFAVDGEAILLRTTPYSLMARDCAGQEVAFEVDEIDDEHRRGWSVLVRGRCEREERPSEGPHPWATGSRLLGLRIGVRSLSGRRIVSSGSADA